jgi:hypothetical protein
MTVEYMKDGATGDTIVSRLEKVEVGIDEDGDPITSCVVVPSEACRRSVLTVRINDRTVRHLISTGYLALESSD